MAMRTTPNIHLTEDDLGVVLMLLSREIVTYRGSPYQGVREYVESCKKIRVKCKRVYEKMVVDDVVPGTPN